MYRDHENRAWQTANLLTIGLVPFWGERGYHVKGEFRKEFSFYLSLFEVRHLFLLPIMPFLDNPYTSTRKIHDQIAKKIFNEIEYD